MMARNSYPFVSVVLTLLLTAWPGWALSKGGRHPSQVGESGNQLIEDFSAAKRLAPKIHQGHEETLYCGCRYHGKTIDLESCGYKPRRATSRATRLEWEHVVPAEAFGRSFVEWREGTQGCESRGRLFKGRKCAETNPEFSRMEADLYNLWPEIGELNGLRSNYAMAELGGSLGEFGRCAIRLRDRKFEPRPEAKGIVARVYMYMDAAYPGRGVISDKNQKLFEAWDKMYPVSTWECERAKRVQQVQGNSNPILDARCSKR